MVYTTCIYIYIYIYIYTCIERYIITNVKYYDYRPRRTRWATSSPGALAACSPPSRTTPRCSSTGIHTYMYTHTYIYIYISYIYIYTYIYIHIYTHIHTHAYIYIYICIYTHICLLVICISISLMIIVRKRITVPGERLLQAARPLELNPAFSLEALGKSPAGQRREGQGVLRVPHCIVEPWCSSAKHGSKNPGFVPRSIFPRYRCLVGRCLGAPESRRNHK